MAETFCCIASVNLTLLSADHSIEPIPGLV
jgi:hypothetical protein